MPSLLMSSAPLNMPYLFYSSCSGLSTIVSRAARIIQSMLAAVHQCMPTGTYISCLWLAWVEPLSAIIDGYGNRCRRFRSGVCEASVGNFHASSRHRAPLSEPAGRVSARMAANQRMEIHRKRNLTPVRNVGIYTEESSFAAAALVIPFPVFGLNLEYTVSVTKMPASTTQSRITVFFGICRNRLSSMGAAT